MRFVVYKEQEQNWIVKRNIIKGLSVILGMGPQHAAVVLPQY